MTWSMDGAGAYVWSAYLLTLAGLAGEVWYLVRRQRVSAARTVSRPSAKVPK